MIGCLKMSTIYGSNFIMTKRKQYCPEDAVKATKMYLEGKKLATVCATCPLIPRRTITRMAKRKKEDCQLKKPGPAPILSVELENDLKDWIVAMQGSGFPVSRDMILVKGNEMYHALYGNRRSIGNLKRGWMNRFLERYPVLTTRTSQVIKRVRVEATEEGLQKFLWELSKHVIERRMASVTTKIRNLKKILISTFQILSMNYCVF